jgi:hypothetical protein
VRDQQVQISKFRFFVAKDSVEASVQQGQDDLALIVCDAVVSHGAKLRTGEE